MKSSTCYQASNAVSRTCRTGIRENDAFLPFTLGTPGTGISSIGLSVLKH